LARNQPIHAFLLPAGKDAIAGRCVIGAGPFSDIKPVGRLL